MAEQMRLSSRYTRVRPMATSRISEPNIAIVPQRTVECPSGRGHRREQCVGDRGPLDVAVILDERIGGQVVHPSRLERVRLTRREQLELVDLGRLLRAVPSDAA